MKAPKAARSSTTIDPTQIQNSAGIPPAHSEFAGISLQKLVDVYNGTLRGDVDAVPAAEELRADAPGLQNTSNADYVYTQVSALYGGAELPSFQGPSGNSVKSLIFVSGSTQGGYGAFHIDDGAQANFDRIVVDSLTVSGEYSASSGLGSPVAHLGAKRAYLLPLYSEGTALRSVLDSKDSLLRAFTREALQRSLRIASHSAAALQHAIDSGNPTQCPKKSSPDLGHTEEASHAELGREVVEANKKVLGLVSTATNATANRKYLSTALFAAELVESFQTLTGKGDPGRTDGEAVSRVLAFKLTPEIALVPGFNVGVTQQWWLDGHPDFVNDNSQTDQSTDGNSASVMFLLFLNDYLGVPLDHILKRMPATNGAPLGETYAALLADFPAFRNSVGADGTAAFNKMISLLEQNVQNQDGTLNLPADGNPFPSMPNSAQGGLFA
jgi:hypothetical protein